MLKKMPILVFSSFLCSVALPAPLKTVIGKNMSPPWFKVSEEGGQEGITPDYLTALEKKLGEKFEVLILPKVRIRMGFDKGRIDFNCHTTPAWAGAPSEKFQWSQPLFKLKTIIVTNSDESISSLESIYGQRVGTVLKYKYPGLDHIFAAGKLFRDEANNENVNLAKLEVGRFKYAVAELHHFNYYLRTHPKSKLKISGVIIREDEVLCWVRKGSRLKLDTLNKAISDIRDDGTLDKIFQKYKLPTAPIQKEKKQNKLVSGEE